MAQLATSAMRPTPREEPAPGAKQIQALALAERRRRQDALLDLALIETFPASDPVSVMVIA